MGASVFNGVFKNVDKRMKYILIIHFVCIYLFAYYFNNNECKPESLPNNFFNFLMKITDFKFFKQYEKLFVANISCFKGVLAFSALLALPHGIILVCINYKFWANKVYDDLKNNSILKNIMQLLLTMMLPIIVLNVTSYGIIKTLSTARNTQYDTIEKIVFYNINSWFAQATISFLFSFFLALFFTQILIYLHYIFKNKTNSEFKMYEHKKDSASITVQKADAIPTGTVFSPQETTVVIKNNKNSFHFLKNVNGSTKASFSDGTSLHTVLFSKNPSSDDLYTLMEKYGVDLIEAYFENNRNEVEANYKKIIATREHSKNLEEESLILQEDLTQKACFLLLFFVSIVIVFCLVYFVINL